MLEALHGYPDNVLALEAIGEVTAEDYRNILVPGVEEKLSTHRRLRLLYVLGAEFSGFTGGAAWEDTKVGMRHFTHFERIAVVTDRDGVRDLVKGFGFMLPGQVRVYDSDELDEAGAWIREPAEPGELAFELDEVRSLLLLEPRDELEVGDFERVAAVVDPFIERTGGLAGIVITAREFPGWDDFAAFSAHLGFVRDHHRTVRRVAVVTDSRFMAALPRLAGLFVNAEVKRFPLDGKSDAMRWAAAA